MPEQTENLTYRQLADRLGLSLEAARARVRRGGWLKITDNHGIVRVSVPVLALNRPGRTGCTVAAAGGGRLARGYRKRCPAWAFRSEARRI